jgi:hypothetical protein
LLHGKEWSSDEDGDGPSLSKMIFLEAWPYVADWIKSNRKAGNLRIAYRMCRMQREHPLQVAFWRLHLVRIRQTHGHGDGEVQNPNDPYRGWDHFFWLDHTYGPRTPEEEWVLNELRIQNMRSVAQAERERRIQQIRGTNTDGARHIAWHPVDSMVNLAPRGFMSLGLPREDSYSDYSNSSDENDSNASDFIHQLPFGYELPAVLQHGRAYRSDEAGDGPVHFCVPFTEITHRIRSCFRSKVDQGSQTGEHFLAHIEHADVPPRCDVCGMPCQCYRWCNFCQQGPVMHHGRCCWQNPGRS